MKGGEALNNRKKNKEGEDYRLQHKTEHRAHARKDWSEGEITQHNDGYIHQIVADKYRSQEFLGLGQQFPDGLPFGRFIKVLYLGRGKREERYFATGYKSGKQQT